MYNHEPGIDVEGMAIDIQTDGKVVVFGEYDEKLVIWKLNTNGTPDTSFGTNGQKIFDSVSPYWFSNAYIDNQGKYIVVGFDLTEHIDILWKLNEDGSFDTSFNTTGKMIISNDIYTSNTQSGDLGDGRIYFLGSDGNEEEGYSGSRVFIFNQDGTLDTDINGNGYIDIAITDGSTRHATSAMLGKDNKIVVFGSLAWNERGGFVSKYNIDGSIDTDFATEGVLQVTKPLTNNTMQVQTFQVKEDGKYLLRGDGTIDGNTNVYLWQVNPDGSLDTNFGTDGEVELLETGGAEFLSNAVFDANGKFTLAGYTGNENGGSNLKIWRFNEDGTLDFSLDTIVDGGLSTDSESGNAIVVDSDNNYYITGFIADPDYWYFASVWKFNNLSLITNLKPAIGAKVGDTDVTTTGASGIKQVKLEKGETIIAEVETDLFQDRDWGNIDADTDTQLKTSFVHGLTEAPGAGSSFALYVPKSVNDNFVRVCPGATSLEEVTSDCTDGYNAVVGDENVSVVEIDGVSYWKILNLTGTGGLSGYLGQDVQDGEEEIPEVVVETLTKTGISIYKMALLGASSIILGTGMIVIGRKFLL